MFYNNLNNPNQQRIAAMYNDNNSLSKSEEELLLLKAIEGMNGLTKAEELGILSGIGIDDLEKGRIAMPIGSHAHWGGVDYLKTASGWKPAGKIRGHVKENHDHLHKNEDKDKDHREMAMDAGKMEESEWTKKHGSTLHAKYKAVHDYLHKPKAEKKEVKPEPVEEKKEEVKTENKEEPKIIRDQAEKQKITNAINEGSLMLRANSSNGKKLTPEHREMIQNQVNKDRAKIGLPAKTDEAEKKEKPKKEAPVETKEAHKERGLDESKGDVDVTPKKEEKPKGSLNNNERPTAKNSIAHNIEPLEATDVQDAKDNPERFTNKIIDRLKEEVLESNDIFYAKKIYKPVLDSLPEENKSQIEDFLSDLDDHFINPEKHPKEDIYEFKTGNLSSEAKGLFDTSLTVYKNANPETRKYIKNITEQAISSNKFKNDSPKQEAAEALLSFINNKENKLTASTLKSDKEKKKPVVKKEKPAEKKEDELPNGTISPDGTKVKTSEGWEYIKKDKEPAKVEDPAPTQTNGEDYKSTIERIEKLDASSGRTFSKVLKEAMLSNLKKAKAAFEIKEYAAKAWNMPELAKDSLTGMGAFFYETPNTIPEFIENQIKMHKDDIERAEKYISTLKNTKSDQKSREFTEDQIKMYKEKIKDYEVDLGIRAKEEPVKENFDVDALAKKHRNLETREEAKEEMMKLPKEITSKVFEAIGKLREEEDKAKKAEKDKLPKTFSDFMNYRDLQDIPRHWREKSKAEIQSIYDHNIQVGNEYGNVKHNSNTKAEARETAAKAKIYLDALNQAEAHNESLKPKEDPAKTKVNAIVNQAVSQYNNAPHVDKAKLKKRMEDAITMHENGLKNNGKGLDETMIAAAKEFLKKVA